MLIQIGDEEKLGLAPFKFCRPVELTLNFFSETESDELKYLRQFVE